MFKKNVEKDGTVELMMEMTSEKIEKLMQELSEKLGKTVKAQATHEAWRCTTEPLEEKEFNAFKERITNFFSERKLDRHINAPGIFRAKHESGKPTLIFTVRKKPVDYY